MTNIKTAKPPSIPKSRHSARPDRPRKDRSSSPLAKGKSSVNRNPSGSHLTPDHVSGNRNRKSGSAKGLDNHQAMSIPKGRTQRGSHVSNTIPKAKSGKSGSYTQK